jgi:cytochrome c553
VNDEGGDEPPSWPSALDGECMRTFVAAILFGALATSAHALTYDEKLPACLSCHGEKGISENPEVPSLAGMPADFTLIQLFLFRQGTRKVEIMNDLAKDMTDDDLRKFSEYFAKLPPPKASGEAPNPEIAARAQAAIAANHCSSCHNPDFSGRDQMPRLAVQREDYLLKALRDYKSAQRPGYDATMDEVIRPVTEQDIVDLAHYLARFN